MATLVRVDKNGSKYYEGEVTCDRCGGQGGSSFWDSTGWTCYKCGGTGKVHAKWIERTPEYQAKLDARRAKRAAEQAEKNRKAEEEYKRRQAELEAKAAAEEEARLKALAEQRAISQYQGEVGGKLKIDVVSHRTVDFETQYDLMHIHIMKDGDGNVYIWKTTKYLGIELEKKDKGGDVIRYEWHPFMDDEPFAIKGTIKEHAEYNGEKQTVLTRCKILTKPW